MNEQKKNTNKKVKKFYIILGMLLILLIPILFLGNIVNDRENYRDEAVNKVKVSWADVQTISPPELNIFIPEKKETVAKSLELNNYEAEVKVKTELRKKGIFTVPVYTADVELKGDFLNSYGDLKNIKSELLINVTDSKGFISQPKFKFLSDKPVTNSSKKYTKILNTNEKSLPFEITYQIRGINEIYVVPGGINNEIEIEGDWSNPSFEGDFLPSEKEITDKDFEAEWKIPAIAVASLNNEPSNLKTNSDTNYGYTPSQTIEKAGVSFLMPVDNYRMATRAVKYSFLFLALTFLAYFIFEITAKNTKPIHQLQYLMMGGAMLIFYLLLVSISEFMAFWGAYIIAAGMTIGLIGLYTYFVITKKENLKFSLLISGIMAILYIFLYVLLALQDLSLIIGSLMLFLIMSLIMYSTRNVEWDNDNNN